MKDENAYIRVSAAVALEEIGTASVPHLLEVINGENKTVRQLAAQALGNIGPAEAKLAIPILIEALREDNMERESAATALVQIGTTFQNRMDTTAIPDLERALAALQEANFSEAPALRRAVESLKAAANTR